MPRQIGEHISDPRNFRIQLGDAADVAFAHPIMKHQRVNQGRGGECGNPIGFGWVAEDFIARLHEARGRQIDLMLRDPDDQRQIAPRRQTIQPGKRGCERLIAQRGRLHQDDGPRRHGRV